MLLELALTLAAARPSLAVDSCCMPSEGSKTAETTTAAAPSSTVGSDGEAGCAGMEKSGCCAEGAASKKEGASCCTEGGKRSMGSCHERWGAMPPPARAYVGVRGGEGFLAGAHGPTAGVVTRMSLGRRFSVGLTADVLRSGPDQSLWTIAVPVRARLLGHCLQLFGDVGPGLGQARYVQAETGRTVAETRPSLECNLGLGLYGRRGWAFELTGGESRTFARGACAGAQACRGSARLFRLSIAHAL